MNLQPPESLKDWKIILPSAGAFLASAWLISYLQNRKYKLPPQVKVLLSDPRYIHEACTIYHKKYGKAIIVKFLLGSFFITCDWKLARYIFDHRSEFPQPKYIRDGFNFRSGLTMFTSEGEVWKHKRHALEPLFHPKLLKQKFHSVNKKLDIFLKIFDEVASKPIEEERKLNIIPLLHRLFTDVIGEVAFGLDFNTLEEPDKIYTDESGKNKARIMDLFEQIKQAIGIRIFLPYWTWRLPFPSFNQEIKNMSILRTLFRKAIEEHSKNLESEVQEDYHGDDLVSLLLSTNRYPDAKKHFYTEDDMLAESFSLYGAGHDTTSTVAALLISMLIENPEVQSKIWEEITEISQANGEDPRTYKPNYDDLNKMKYIENVVKEALRLYPAAPFVVRESTEDAQVGDYFIPKGLPILLNIYEIQRDPQYFPDPEKCIPERWNNTELTAPTFLSFGFGSRICFGRKFALVELKAITFRIFQRFITEFHEKPKVLNVAGLSFENESFFIKLKHRS